MKEFATPKKWHIVVLLAIVVCAVMVYFRSKQWTTMTLYHNTTRIEVLVADTYPKQFQGLSDRNTIYPYDGMLFPFGIGGSHPMVMRNMRFPIDLVWLNGPKIVHIVQNATPEPGRKEMELTLYSSDALSTSVLEVPAGKTAEWGLKVGDTLLFEK